MTKRHGTQPGDPQKAAKAMYELAVLPDPPLRCVLGSDAYSGVKQKLEEHARNVEKFEVLSKGTDVDR